MRRENVSDIADTITEKGGKSRHQFECKKYNDRQQENIFDRGLSSTLFHHSIISDLEIEATYKATGLINTF